MNSKFEKKLSISLKISYNIKDLGWKRNPAIRLKIMVQTHGIDSGMYSLRPFWILYDTPSKAEN